MTRGGGGGKGAIKAERVFRESAPPPPGGGDQKGEWGGGWSGTQKFMYQRWPDKMFPIANFVCPHDDPFGLGGRGFRGGYPDAPLLLWCTATAILMLPLGGRGANQLRYAKMK